jgi:leucyl/phenylalanyl-tRNA--protein transferase
MDWNTKPAPVGETRWRFPSVSEMPDSDLVTLGGDLLPSTLIHAYRQGIFPMDVTGLPGVIGWWSPDPRGILPLEGLRVTRSMRQSARKFEIRIDSCFGPVIRACADPRRKDGWITDEFVRAYERLHDLAWAHSVEVFDRHNQLAGGLYGVRFDGVFAGESMFHHQRDASKVALMALVELMRDSRMALLDVQWCTEHLASLGAIAISRAHYVSRLGDAIGTPTPR